MAFGQSDSLALSSAVVPPGGTAVLNLTLTSPAGYEPAALQWTFTYSPTDIVALSAAIGSTATAAGKSLSCEASAGTYTCMLTGLGPSGLNANIIQNGTVAVVTATLSPASSATSINVTNGMAAAAPGAPIPLTGSAGTITVAIPVALTLLSCSPASVLSGGSSTCTVTLNQPAPAGGAIVALSTNNATLTVPAAVTVPASSTSANFTATLGTITTNQSATVTATLNGSSQAATLSLVAPTLVSSLTCNPTSVNSGSSTTCTVTLNQAAATGGAAVALSTNNAALTVPAAVTVPASSTSANFIATLGTITTNQSATVTATLNGSSQAATLSLVAPTLVSSLSCNPASVNSGSSTTCTVTLSQAAATGGASVALSTNNAALTVPAAVTVPASSTSATFTATAGTVTISQSATITATLNASSQATTLSLLDPVLISTLSCDSNSLLAGASSNCTVTLTAPAPQGGVDVSVSSDHAAVTVPASVAVPAASSTATFQATAGTEPLTGDSTQTVTVTAALNGASQAAAFSVTICPCSLWPVTAQPLNPDSGSKQSIEVGMQFTSSMSGYVTGLRFFKAPKNKGTHSGYLWDSTGNQLAAVKFTNETASGWQTAYFPSPVAISANTTYVISYMAPQGHTAADNGGFTTAVSNLPLQAPADGQNGPNGVYVNAANTFPTTGASATNYWVDVIFNTSPNIGTATPITLWTPDAVPGTPAAATSKAEVGLTFLSSVPGYVTGLRFYKGSTNLGTHIGYLWTNTGAQLATVTFTGETATGWQQANFSSPVAITANTAYVISYWAPRGHYADDAAYFSTSGVTSQMLYAPPDGQYGPNGAYSSSKAFPSGTASGTNYWLDVVFTTAIQ